MASRGEERRGDKIQRVVLGSRSVGIPIPPFPHYLDTKATDQKKKRRTKKEDGEKRKIVMLAWVLQLGKSKMEIFSLFVQVYLKKSAVKISKVRDRFYQTRKSVKEGRGNANFGMRQKKVNGCKMQLDPPKWRRLLAWNEA